MTMGKINTKSLILLAATVLVWGYFFYRFWNITSEGENVGPTDVTGSYRPNKVAKKEHFELIPTQRDPFLGTIKKKTTGVRKTTKKKEPIDWPMITYLGMVEDGKGRTKVFILQINGQQQLVSPKETVQEITLLRGNSEMAVVRYRGQTKEIKL